jgi:hypothetical protein
MRAHLSKRARATATKGTPTYCTQIRNTEASQLQTDFKYTPYKNTHTYHDFGYNQLRSFPVTILQATTN